MAITVYPPEAAEDYERISENFEQSVQRAAIAYHTEMLDETISDTLALTHFQASMEPYPFR